MPEVQSIGVVDPQQYQLPQYQTNDIQQTPEGYEAYPVYDAGMEEKKSSSHLLGYSLVGLGCLAAGLLIGRKGNSSKLAEAQTKLVELQNSEAVKNYDALKKSHEGLKNAAEDMMKEANDVEKSFWKPWTWFGNDRKFSVEKMKEHLKDFINVDAKSEKALEKEAKEAGDKAKDSAKDKAKDSAKKD